MRHLNNKTKNCSYKLDRAEEIPKAEENSHSLSLTYYRSFNINETVVVNRQCNSYFLIIDVFFTHLQPIAVRMQIYMNWLPRSVYYPQRLWI